MNRGGRKGNRGGVRGCVGAGRGADHCSEYLVGGQGDIHFWPRHGEQLRQGWQRGASGGRSVFGNSFRERKPKRHAGRGLGQGPLGRGDWKSGTDGHGRIGWESRPHWGWRCGQTNFWDRGYFLGLRSGHRSHWRCAGRKSPVWKQRFCGRYRSWSGWRRSR